MNDAGIVVVRQSVLRYTSQLNREIQLNPVTLP